MNFRDFLKSKALNNKQRIRFWEWCGSGFGSINQSLYSFDM